MKRSPINKTSNSHIKALRVYDKVKKVYLSKTGRCEKCGITDEVCDLQLHHAAGRGRYLCDVRYFRALCGRCHRWVHQYPADAMKKGFLLNKFILDRNE